MCLNKEISIGVFTVCSVSSVYLFKRNRPNDRWIAIFAGYVGFMQYLEYLMWTDPECTGLNQYATHLGFWHNISQPFLSLALAYYFTQGNLPSWVYMVCILYATTSLPKIWDSQTNDMCSQPCGDNQYGLSWTYTETPNQTYVWGIFCLAIAAPLLTMKKQGHMYAGLVVGMYIIAHFISVSRCPHSITPPNGSWWCIMSAFIPVMGIYLN